MHLFHNSQDPACRWPLGALPTGSTVRLTLFAQGAKAVTLRTWNGEEMSFDMKPSGLSGWEISLPMPRHPGLLWYDFRVEDERGRRLYCGNAADKLGGLGASYFDSPPSFQITVYDPAFDPPSYLREGIMYQIFPDRFHRTKPPQSDREGIHLHQNWDDTPMIRPGPRSHDNQANDFFGGDLKGIEEKLPYLKELGVTILYLNPIFKSYSNHRYDTGDYGQVDPLLGTNEDFQALCHAAKALGIRVMLDGVFSHTGEDSLYFNKYGSYPSLGAYQSKDSKYYPWYRFMRFPERYAAWWNITTLPEINKDAPSFREFILGREGIARRWIGLGATGWRLDVADELPMSFLRELRKSVRAEQPDAVLLGEVWEDASNKVAYGKLRSYCVGDSLDSVMNYPLREVLIRFLTRQTDAPQVVRVLRSLQENYPTKFFYSLMNLLGSHDRARILNVLVQREYVDLPVAERGKPRLPEKLKALAVERFKKMLRIIIALPGMPAIYYGDEAGMEGGPDPYCRGTFPWGNEDQNLTAFVKECFMLRHSRPVLKRGSFDIAAEGADTLLITRGLLEGGKDVFGEPLHDSPYTLRISRDLESLGG